MHHARYKANGTLYLSRGTWYQEPDTRYMEPGTRVHVTMSWARTWYVSDHEPDSGCQAPNTRRSGSLLIAGKQIKRYGWPEPDLWDYRLTDQPTNWPTDQPTNWPTDGWMDRKTDGQTHELRGVTLWSPFLIWPFAPTHICEHQLSVQGPQYQSMHTSHLWHELLWWPGQHHLSPHHLHRVYSFIEIHAFITHYSHINHIFSKGARFSVKGHSGTCPNRAGQITFATISKSALDMLDMWLMCGQCFVKGNEQTIKDCQTPSEDDKKQSKDDQAIQRPSSTTRDNPEQTTGKWKTIKNNHKDHQTTSKEIPKTIKPKQNTFKRLSKDNQEHSKDNKNN